jgi:nitroreductase
MNVTEAIKGRHSIRAFLPKPVEKEKLDAILTVSLRAPSWANSQPWEVFVATGATLERIRKGFQQKYAEKAASAPETPRPAQWTDAAVKRREQLNAGMKRDCGNAVEQFGPLNQALFNAPTVVYICMDKVLSEWSLYDIGAYSQTFMLAALEQGLSTIPAIMLTVFPDVLRRELQIPDNLKVTIGIAVGYADKENRINDFISDRKPLGETVRFFD